MKQLLNNRLFCFLVLFFTFLLVGCDRSPTAKASSLKLSAQELGTREHLVKHLNFVASSLRKIDRSLSKAVKAKENRNFGISDKYYVEANKEIYKWRDWIVKKVAGKPRIVYPSSMAGIERAIKNLKQLRYSLPVTGRLNQEQLSNILNALRLLANADAEFGKKVSNRKTNPDLMQAKTSLVFELKPFPFSIEVLSGELKVKQSFSVGNLAGNFGISNSGTRKGIRTLILVHDGFARVYAVGNRKLSFNVPASRIEINGSIMWIRTL